MKMIPLLLTVCVLASCTQLPTNPGPPNGGLAALVNPLQPTRPANPHAYKKGKIVLYDYTSNKRFRNGILVDTDSVLHRFTIDSVNYLELHTAVVVHMQAGRIVTMYIDPQGMASGIDKADVARTPVEDDPHVTVKRL